MIAPKSGAAVREGHGGSGSTDVGRVTVDIACLPDDPTAADDTATRAEDSAATAVAVLANDNDPATQAVLEFIAKHKGK